MVFSFILVFKNFLNFKYELSSLELQFLAKKLFLINLHYLGVLTNLNQFKTKDELDKTLAEYDTNSSATTATITNINTVCSASVNQLNSSLSNRILANDANAASIRTR